METNRRMKEGKLTQSYTSSQKNRDWANLTQKLNEEGGCIKNMNQWQKSWSDIKVEVKKKYNHNKLQGAKTGGGKPAFKPYTELDERVKALLGTDLLDGFEDNDDDDPVPSTLKQTEGSNDGSTTNQVLLHEEDEPEERLRVNSQPPLRRSRVRALALEKKCCEKLVEANAGTSAALINIGEVMKAQLEFMKDMEQKRLQIEQQKADAMSSIAQSIASFASAHNPSVPSSDPSEPSPDPIDPSTPFYF